MDKDKRTVLALAGLLVVSALLVTWFLATHHVAILSPKGIVASRERGLMALALGLAVIVVIPVFAMLFGFAWKYRAGNKKADYRPEWGTHKVAEAIWWGIPILIIGILSATTWTSSHSLDPPKALASTKNPLTIQVIALEWKWLFIYPDQEVASINEVVFPEQTPVRFQITSDAPMNSFWIPELGGQIYAMTGMTTQLNLMADHIGDFPGVSANISGEGFAGMKFTARSVSTNDFDVWVDSIHATHEQNGHRGGLDQELYTKLAQPSKYNAVERFALHDTALYDSVLAKYMPEMRTDAMDTGLDAHTESGATLQYDAQPATTNTMQHSHMTHTEAH